MYEYSSCTDWDRVLPVRSLRWPPGRVRAARHAQIRPTCYTHAANTVVVTHGEDRSILTSGRPVTAARTAVARVAHSAAHSGRLAP